MNLPPPTSTLKKVLYHEDRISVAWHVFQFQTPNIPVPPFINQIFCPTFCITFHITVSALTHFAVCRRHFDGNLG